MAYHLEWDEPLAAGVRRIIVEKIEAAAQELREPVNGRHKAVHSARKSCKRIRAGLRLVRDAIGEEAYQRENVYFRDASRLLAPVRDSVVVVKALDALVNRFASDLPDGAFAGIRQRLVERHEAISRRLLDESDVMAETAVVLQAGKRRILDLPLAGDDFEPAAGGLHRVYRRGRKRMALAYAQQEGELFHDWRKRVKYLWYHLDILQPVWPSRLAQQVEDLHQLSDYLGDAHDLLELGRILQTETDRFGGEAEIPQLLDWIEAWQRDFEAAARPLGLRLYAEKPNQFVQRINRYWQVWRGEGGLIAGPSLDTAVVEPKPEPETAEPPLYLSTREAAERMNMSMGQIRRLIYAGKLPATKIGHFWVIAAEDLPSP